MKSKIVRLANFHSDLAELEISDCIMQRTAESGFSSPEVKHQTVTYNARQPEYVNKISIFGQMLSFSEKNGHKVFQILGAEENKWRDHYLAHIITWSPA